MGSPTSGKWRTSHDGHGGIMIASGDVQIGYASSAFGKQEANARLMAASPELLQAAHLVRMSRGWHQLSEVTKALIDEAIAKATNS